MYSNLPLSALYRYRTFEFTDVADWISPTVSPKFFVSLPLTTGISFSAGFISRIRYCSSATISLARYTSVTREMSEKLEKGITYTIKENPERPIFDITIEILCPEPWDLVLYYTRNRIDRLLARSAYILSCIIINS